MDGKIDINEELKNNFFVYATCVNNERSFPDVRDGLKPVMRATLWAMYTDKYLSSKPHVKCAKITGATIARLHPHGDVAVYDALVRLSQPWIQNIASIDFHGNNGSLLGGPRPANQRYTECRLSKAAEDCYFTNINDKIVNYIDNFAEDEKWPEVFTSIAPMLMINGSSGIGYTIAQDWLPHNLKELSNKVKEYLNCGSVSTNDIYPDFPTGGIIINKSELHKIYETGKGTVILRGRASIDKNIIKITELPYQVYVEDFIKNIKKLIIDEKLTGISDICNKSDESGMLIEVECEDEPKLVLNSLYKYSDLQVYLSANQMALVDGAPKMLNLSEYLSRYIDYNTDIIVKEFTYDKNKAEERLNIVDGLLLAVENIEDVINAVKSAKTTNDAKKELIALGWNDLQAQAIIEMRIGRLVNMESSGLQKEKTELNKKIKQCAKILSNKKYQQEEFIKRLDEFTDKYGWDRRTEVIDAPIEGIVTTEKKHKIEKEYTVILKDGKLKRVESTEYKGNDITVSGIASDKITMITSDGMMYKCLINDILLGTNRSSGDYYKHNIKNIIGIYSNKCEGDYFIFVTKNGLIKKISRSNVIDVRKTVGTVVMSVNEDDEIVYITCTTSKVIHIDSKSARKENYYEINTDDLIAKGRSAGGTKKINGNIIHIC